MIVVLLLVICVQNFLIIRGSKVAIHSNSEPVKVEIYRDGKPIGAGLRATRGNGLPVDVIGRVEIDGTVRVDGSVEIDEPVRVIQW
ncbi:hypothetical protein L0244_10895 [bacterium]|nr:hypothetical protein [bacterium]MCI0690384.1 hypothetical protein [candidate division KSB1 bacterium]